MTVTLKGTPIDPKDEVVKDFIGIDHESEKVKHTRWAK